MNDYTVLVARPDGGYDIEVVSDDSPSEAVAQVSAEIHSEGKQGRAIVAWDAEANYSF